MNSPFDSFQGSRGGMMNVTNNRTGQGIGSTRNGNRMGFRPVSGEVISSDDASFTVKLQDGSSKIVLYSSKSTINKASEATKSDVVPGEKVMVMGTENADGSITAQNIQLNPVVGMRRSMDDVASPAAK